MTTDDLDLSFWLSDNVHLLFTPQKLNVNGGLVAPNEPISGERSRKARISMAPQLVAPGLLSFCRGYAERQHSHRPFVTTGARIRFPHPLPVTDGTTMITVHSPSLFEEGVGEPPAYELFGPDGSLGLRAVTLYVNPRDVTKTEMALVLDSRDPEADEAAYNAVRFSVNGTMNVHHCRPALKRNGALDADLGIIARDDAWQGAPKMVAVSDKNIGFPEAIECVIRYAQDIGTYFADLAKAYRT